MDSIYKLKQIQKDKQSILCVGLDSDLSKIPDFYEKNVDSLYDFNCRIIDATVEFTSAYKLNFAFYEQYGAKGLEIIKSTIDYIGNRTFIIADSKRGDIGNTSEAYANSCYNYFNADSITVAPYMGFDSVQPFLNFKEKLTFVLALTSNKGSDDFQRLIIDGKPLFMHVIEKCLLWGDVSNLGFVVGATHPDDLLNIRAVIPDNFLLIPGVGTQGGDIKSLLKSNGGSPCTINVSRDIIYAGKDADFTDKVAKKAKFYREEFNRYF